MPANEVPLSSHVDVERMSAAAARHLRFTLEEWLHVHECRPCLEVFAEIILEREAA